MHHMYLLLTRRVPFALGISPFAFKLAVIVNPMDFPCFHLRSALRSFLVAR